ncbi:hypothetical protein BDK51DRAFT_39137 [Blyttiomyces helicus]|uniref:REJ domain-containing protein n=1 Tax=Blyttiomyces helicus TaxID=388810 RepID=A0A4P9VYW5_9FUNG|nr:hypothetical protein BDK51DRAFT_39137 [Blyttiomyces helicus]|eukprot:RKO84989.1 hypothetical protein BDK51DRAFT_39137 [Blyttiomyces helicus]
MRHHSPTRLALLPLLCLFVHAADAANRLESLPRRARSLAAAGAANGTASTPPSPSPSSSSSPNYPLIIGLSSASLLLLILLSLLSFFLLRRARSKALSPYTQLGDPSPAPAMRAVHRSPPGGRQQLPVPPVRTSSTRPSMEAQAFVEVALEDDV